MMHYYESIGLITCPSPQIQIVFFAFESGNQFGCRLPCGGVHLTSPTEFNQYRFRAIQ